MYSLSCTFLKGRAHFINFVTDYNHGKVTNEYKQGLENATLQNAYYV